MRKRHHVAQQMLKEQQEKKDNGSIELTADQLWKYSGKNEEHTHEYTQLISEFNECLKARRVIPTRKEYFKKYWIAYKQKQKQKQL